MNTAARWCDQHNRYECTSMRRYRDAYCHSKPMRGTAKCISHTVRAPAKTAKELARQQVSVAMADGNLTRPSECELCGSKEGDWRTWCLSAHHEDYARPLDVLWLCGPCHRRVHGNGLPAYLEWLRGQLAGAERLYRRFYEQRVDDEVSDAPAA